MEVFMQLLCIDTQVYLEDAIERAIYDFSGILQLRMRKKGKVIIIGTNSQEYIELFSSEDFLASVLDHQLRIKLEATTTPIRTMIVGRALYPDGKIEDVVAKLLSEPPTKYSS